jgi:hypothetical protein
MIDYQQSYQYGLSRKEPLMGFRLQHLSDDDKFVHALRFEGLEQVCPRVVSERLDALPCLGRARTPPEPSHRGLLRHRARPISPPQPGRRVASVGHWDSLALAGQESATANGGRAGLPGQAIGHTGDAPCVPARLPTDGDSTDQRRLPLRPASDGWR